MQGRMYNRTSYPKIPIASKHCRFRIVNANYLATEHLCRWFVILMSDKSPIPRRGNYASMVAKARSTLPLLLPFGCSYVLLNIEIIGNEMNLIVKSPYKGEAIPIDRLGLLAYMAIEILKRGSYRKDPFMSRYEKYYDKFREYIPEDYRITVNGEYTTFNYRTLEEIYQKFPEIIEDLSGVRSPVNPPQCQSCPFKNACAYLSATVNLIDLHMLDFFHNIPRIYHALRNAGVNALLYMGIYMFNRFRYLNVDESLISAAEYLSEGKNKAIYVKFGVEPRNRMFLSLLDGNVYKDACQLVLKNPNMRIFDESGDVTDELVIKSLILRSLLTSRNSNEINKFLKDYPENEKYILYFSFLSNNSFAENIFYARGTVDENDPSTMYLNEKNGVVDLLSTIYNSKLYKEGYIEVDNKNLKVYPTKKLLNTLSSLCMGGE